MTYKTSRTRSDGSTSETRSSSIGTPGKRTLVETAAQGVAGPGGALPHLAAIQASFGPAHDLSSVRAHSGVSAASAADAIGAEAYATGHDVAFGSSPDLHTAAHEAAHVVQQQQGVQLYGGVGAEGDVYERNADEVADRVVAGRSAADLLPAATTAGGAPAVQRRDKKEKPPSDSTVEERDDQKFKSDSASGDAATSMAYLYAQRIDRALKKVEAQLEDTADDELGAGDIKGLAADALVDLCDKAMADLHHLELVLGAGQGGMAGPLGMDELNHAIIRVSDVVRDLHEPDVTTKFGALRDLNHALRAAAGLGGGNDDQEPGAPKNAKTKEDTLLKAAIKDNLDASEASARLLRMDLATAEAKDLTETCVLVHHHLDAADALLGEAAKPKKFKKDVKRVTAEIAAMFAEADKRDDLKDVAIFKTLRSWVVPQILKRVGAKKH